MNAECFKAYVETFLVPELKPGDIVILDNLSSHKSKEVKAIIRQAGAQAHLPAALFPRPEPHRNGLFKTQNASQKSS